MFSKTANVGPVLVLMLAGGCGPTVRPAPPVVSCSPVAQGKVVHLDPIEDWRTDETGDRQMGEAIGLDSGYSVRNLVLGSVVSALDCMGFVPAEKGEGVPELRIAIIRIESRGGKRPGPAQETSQPEPGSPESLPGYQPIKPALYHPGSEIGSFLPALHVLDDEEEWEEEEDLQAEDAPVEKPDEPDPMPEDPRASLMLTVKAALFHPPEELVLETEITVTAHGPVVPPADAPDGPQRYVRDLGLMVTDALAALGTELVRALSQDQEILASLPTVDQLTAADQKKVQKTHKGEKATFASSAGPEKVTEKDQFLWSALSLGDYEKAKKRIDDGANPATAVGIEGFALLHLMAIANDPDGVDDQLDEGVSVDVTADGHITALHLASRLGNLAVAKLLVKRGADPMRADAQGYTSLHHAAAGGSIGVIKFLVGAREMDVDADPTETLTPLMAAVRAGRMDSLEFLVGKGADVNEPSLGGLTALHHAAEANQPEIAEYLIKKGCEPDQRDAFLKTPLHHAVEQCPETESCLAVVEVLVDNGADRGALDTDGKKPLDYAMYNDDAELMEYLAK